jgi:hypothetical protein
MQEVLKRQVPKLPLNGIYFPFIYTQKLNHAVFPIQGFVIVSALLVTALLQFIFDGKPPSVYCLVALPLVMASIFIYQKYPYVDRKKKD